MSDISRRGFLTGIAATAVATQLPVPAEAAAPVADATREEATFIFADPAPEGHLTEIFLNGARYAVCGAVKAGEHIGFSSGPGLPLISRHLILTPITDSAASGLPEPISTETSEFQIETRVGFDWSLDRKMNRHERRKARALAR
jgi:hypothetical protein